jgi:hypothetical protein
VMSLRVIGMFPEKWCKCVRMRMRRVMSRALRSAG